MVDELQKEAVWRGFIRCLRVSIASTVAIILANPGILENVSIGQISVLVVPILTGILTGLEKTVRVVRERR